MRWLKCLAKLIGRGIGYSGLGFIWYWIVYGITTIIYNLIMADWTQFWVYAIIITMMLGSFAVGVYLLKWLLEFVIWALEPPLLDEKMSK